jgi:ribosomal protein S18 acetylase RimI-like enzyme
MLLRPATPADALEVARVHVRAWQVGYRGLLPDAFLDGLRAEERADRYTFGDPDPQQPFTTVALEDGAIRAFVTIGPAIPQTSGAGHLMALYVDPERWRRGLGRMLLAEGCRQLVERGHREAVLWVLVGNRAAEQLYLNCGWVVDGEIEPQEVWGVKVNNQRYRYRLPAAR